MDDNDVVDLLQIVGKKSKLSIPVQSMQIKELRKSMKVLTGVAFSSSSAEKSTVIRLQDLQDKLNSKVSANKFWTQTLEIAISTLELNSFTF